MRSGCGLVGWACLLAVSVLAGTSVANAETPAQLLETVREIVKEGRGDQFTSALQTCNQIIANAAADKAVKQGAFEAMLSIHSRGRKFPELIKAADTMIAAFPGDPAVEQKAMAWQVEAYAEWGRNAEVLSKGQDFMKKHSGNKVLSAQVQSRMAEFYLRANKAADAYQAAKASLEADTSSDAVAVRALDALQDAAYKQNEYAKAADALLRLLEPKYAAKQGPNDSNGTRARYADCLVKLKKYDDARAFLTKQEKTAGLEPRIQAEWCLRAADTFVDEGRFDDAVKAYDRVFTDHPDTTEFWYQAQKKTVDALRKKGDFGEALKAARICLDAAPDAGAIVESVRTIAELIKAADKDNVARANVFISYQKFGPSGADKQPGTADDLKNPLEAIPYPSYPDRRRALGEAGKAAGDSSEAARFRAIGYTYTGNPKEALRQFVDAFGRCTSQEIRRHGDEMIIIGARAVRGHAVGLDEFYSFVNFGPSGPDGKPGTPDDQPDPFAALMK